MNKKLIQSLIGVLVVPFFICAFQFPFAGAVENEWTTKASMATARGGLGVAVVNGKIYAIGGLNNNMQLALNEEYNPVTDKWAVKASMPTARSGFAIAVYQNKIYCIGGIIGSDDLVSGFTGVNEVYDPATNTWETKATMPTPRADLCANVVNGKIYLIGGKEYWQYDPFYHELNVTEVYDPVKNSWTTKASMPIPAFGYASEEVDDKIYVIGGARQFQQGLENIVTIGSNQVYDSKNNTWSSGDSLPLAVSHAAACVTSGVTAPKRIYVVGGFDQTNHTSKSIYAYDFEHNVWGSGALMPTSRANLGLAVVDDVLYAIGGFDGLNLLKVNEKYAPLGYGSVPPELQIVSPENKTYSSKSVQLVLTVSRATNWIGYSLDRQANVTVTGDTMLSGLREGAHNIKVWVNDTFGNIVSSDTFYFSVDTVPPKIAILFPENKTYGETDIKSTFTVNEPVSWMGYSLDGQENMTIQGNVTLAVLPEGSHNLTCYATDLVGNTGASETICFVIAPFPTILVAAVAVTMTIAVAAAYLLLKRRKMICPSKTK